MDCLDVVGMIVPPRSSHSAGTDMVRNDVVVIRKRTIAQSAHAVLGNDLPVHQLPHLGVRSDLPVSAGVMSIINPTDSHLLKSSFFREGHPAATDQRAVNWAQLVSAEFHRFPLRMASGVGSLKTGTGSLSDLSDQLKPTVMPRRPKLSDGV